MKEFISKLFSTDSGVSSMRVMAMMSLTASIVIAFYGMSKQQIDYSGISFLCGTFIAGAFGGKVLQKREEVTGSKSEMQREL